MRAARFILFFFALFALSAEARPAAQPFNPVNTDLGYGFNVAEWNVNLVQGMGFNWIKVFNAPGSRLPVGVLLRIEARHDTGVSALRGTVRSLAQNNGAFIDAYEIGNEVNLDASYGWGNSPEAERYVELLCGAYAEIKAVDPTAVVVSAGLAPVGRVTGSWNGRAGHNGLYQDEREFFKEMLDTGAGNCLDAVGYHNYGYSADYDAVPDINGGSPATNCTNGFCFRGVEKIYEIMQSRGLGQKKVWTTEFGWIIDPGEEGAPQCKGDPSWQGRLWQIVSRQKQADNLAGAYTYAAENWSWMGAIFAFNLNFNTAGYYPLCEQMRFYGVAGRPAESALRAMPKAYNYKQPQPVVTAAGIWGQMALPADLPRTHTVSLTVANVGDLPLTYAVTIDGTADLVPVVISGPASGQLNGGASQTINLSWETGSPGKGRYGGQVTVAVDPPAAGFPLSLPLDLIVVDQIQRDFLPVLFR